MVPSPIRSGLVSVEDLSDRQVEDLFVTADAVRDGSCPVSLAGKVVAPMFFTPSTRTRISFETAALRAGGSVAGFADPSTTRCHPSTGETFEDCVRTLSQIADVLVVRSAEPDAGRRAAAVANCPVVNAGDPGEHPTQGLIDAYTLRTHLPVPFAEASVAFMGCVDNRCTKPLLALLTRFGIAEVVFLVEEGADAPAHVKQAAARRGARVRVTCDLDDVLATCHALSVAPWNTRFVHDPSVVYPEDLARTPESHVVTAERIRASDSRTLVLHPLPRRNEIATCVDRTPNAAYFEQVRFSVPMRIAILGHVTRSGEDVLREDVRDPR